MLSKYLLKTATALAAGTLFLLPMQSSHVKAQDTAAVQEAQAPEPLSADEMEILVARIALYPDELVAVIISSSLYPLQIVQAQRLLDDLKTKPDLKPDADWDGSVISLMNYPQIVKMMSDDLDWTEAIGEAVTYQQKDVLTAIQQLRDKAIAMGVLKSDEKTVIVHENDNVVIQPAAAEMVYVPQYEPAMLYEPDYVAVPIVYYPDPYPNYYYPTAPYFAAFVTGAVWGAMVDWDDWGVWGGRWDNDVDIDIDCHKCFNDVDFNGKVNINDVDWKKVDRTKIDVDKNQFTKVNKTKYKTNIRSNSNNSVKAKAADVSKTRATTLPGKTSNVSDVRKSTIEGLQSKPAAKPARPASKPAVSKPAASTPVKKPATTVDRPVGKPKPAAKADARPKNPSPIGEVSRGKDTKIQSDRGGRSMGGGSKVGNGPAKKKKKMPGRK